MASYEIDRGQIAVHAKTLTGSTADTITWQDEVEAAEVITDGTDDVYVATDGAPATVAGGNCYRVPASSEPASRVVNVALGSLSIVSASAVVYSVETADSD